jgi:hypothetical protein
MSDKFVSEVLPVVQRYANLRFRGDEWLVTACISMAWYIWSNRREDFPPSNFAQLAARNVAAGRDLPGCGTSAKDALHRADFCGGMDGLGDWHPGPEQIAIDRERYTRVTDDLDDRMRTLVEMFESGAKNKDVAEALEVSPGRVTQLRQGLMDKDE